MKLYIDLLPRMPEIPTQFEGHLGSFEVLTRELKKEKNEVLGLKVYAISSQLGFF